MISTQFATKQQSKLLYRRQRPGKFWPNKFERKKIKADNRYWVELHLQPSHWGGIFVSEKHQMKAAASHPGWVSVISPPAILFSGINERNIPTIKSTTNSSDIINIYLLVWNIDKLLSPCHPEMKSHHQRLFLFSSVDTRQRSQSESEDLK